jgi:hypothetical protein
MSFENVLPERDGTAAIATIIYPHGLNALNATVSPLGRVVLDVPRSVVARAVRTAGR